MGTSNIINASGIQIESYTDIVSDIINGTPQTPGLLTIYGPDINVASNTPDGQLVNLMALSKLDMEQFAVGIYSSFDPDQAIGIALDVVAQYNGLVRKAGTYTETGVVVTTSQTVNLIGLDNTLANVFTISDDNGTLFYLINSVTIGAGTTTLNFRAANIGFVQVVENTLTVIVTPQLGVLLVNNPDLPYSIGAVQETDAQFRLRRQQSTSGISTRKAMAMYAALNQLPGVEQAVVYENVTATTNSLGVPPHSIWPIVLGGTAPQIVQAIYYYLGDGCGNKGSNSYQITQLDGSQFTVYYDIAQQAPLWIHVNVESLISGFIDTAGLAAFLVANYILGINQVADITTLTALIKSFDTNLLVTSAAVSKDNSLFIDEVTPPAVNFYFIVQTSHITITTI